MSEIINEKKPQLTFGKYYKLSICNVDESKGKLGWEEKGTYETLKEMQKMSGISREKIRGVMKGTKPNPIIKIEQLIIEKPKKIKPKKEDIPREKIKYSRTHADKYKLLIFNVDESLGEVAWHCKGTFKTLDDIASYLKVCKTTTNLIFNGKMKFKYPTYRIEYINKQLSEENLKSDVTTEIIN